MTLKKPKSIKDNPFKSAKWDEIVKGRDFRDADVPVIALLCQWYEVVDKCMDDLHFPDGIRVAYQNDLGDIKAYPQLSTMKQASAEIRAINKQLGINDEATAETKPSKETMLYVIQGSRKRKSGAANTA